MNRDPISVRSLRFAQQVGQGPDVVLVGVGEHDRVYVTQPFPHRAEVGQDQVHTRLRVLREQHATVDDEQPARVLEDSHVAADLPEAAQSEQAQAVRGQGWRGAEIGVRVAHGDVLSRV